MRQRHPHRTSLHQEFNVDGIRVTGGNGYDQRLIDAVDLLLRPAVGGLKITIHRNRKTIPDRTEPGNHWRITSLLQRRVRQVPVSVPPELGSSGASFAP